MVQTGSRVVLKLILKEFSFHFGGKQGKDRKGLAGINGRLRGQGMNKIKKTLLVITALK